MTIEWNPNAKTVEGLEHREVGWAHAPSFAFSDQNAVTFKARHTGPITDIQFFASPDAFTLPAGSGFPGMNSPFMVDLYPSGSESWGPVVQSVFTVSNVLSFSAGVFNTSGGAPVAADLNAFQDNQAVFMVQPRAYIDLQFNTAAFALNQRILRLGLELWVNATSFVQRADNGAAVWEGQILAAGTGTNVPAIFNHGEGRVLAGSPNTWTWFTPQFIRDLRSGGPHFYRVASDVSGFWVADVIRLHVVHAPETRIGTGIATFTAGGQWINISLKTPAGTGQPTIVSGSAYTAVSREVVGESHYPGVGFTRIPVRYLRGLPLDPTDHKRSLPQLKVPDGAANPDFEGNYWLNGPVESTGLSSQLEGITAVRLISGGVYQPETQPYEEFGSAAVWGGTKDIIPLTSAPASGCALTQTIAISGTGEVYGQLLAMIGVRSHEGLVTTDGPLRFEVLDSANASVLGFVEITLDDWNRAPETAVFNGVDQFGAVFKRLRVRFPLSVALAAGLYTIKVTGPTVSESKRWIVGTLVSRFEVGNVEATSMGFSSEAVNAWVFAPFGTPGYVNIGAGSTFGDAQVVLTTVPPPVTGLGTASGILHAFSANVRHNQTCLEQGCADEGSPFVQLTWSVTSDTQTIGYDIQRKDQANEDWKFVARVLGRTTTNWNDHEHRIGVRTCYRIRSFRPDGIVGDWSAESCITPPTGQIALTFTSNAATGMAVCLPEVWNDGSEVERSWAFAEYDDVVQRPIYGRDGQLSFHPIERRGEVFSRVLLLNALKSVVPPTLEIARPLRDLSWAQVPYVCVRDGEGNRWFSSITVPQVITRRRGERWYGEVTVTVAATVPAIADTSVAQVTSVG